MKKILTVIGARPQIIKSAALSRAISQRYSDRIEQVIVHTGQHYDTLMSSVFIDELGIPAPRYNLAIGSGTHAWQTAHMLTSIADTLNIEHPDGVVVYGDTNSTLAGALAASKMLIPVFHIEAGLRSFNRAMPEEQNRIVADHLATRLYAPTQTALDNLSHEGLLSRTLLSGDIMLDNTLFYTRQASQSDILARYGLSSDAYILATIHRDFNTDHRQRLTSVIEALGQLASAHHIPVVLPLHPRTRKQIELFSIPIPSGLSLIPPVSYLEMLALENHSLLVVTDSGGVQKEAFFVGKPCIILRPETEWKEIVDAGAALLADTDAQRIDQSYRLLTSRPLPHPPLFGDGHASEAILDDILQHL